MGYTACSSSSSFDLGVGAANALTPKVALDGNFGIRMIADGSDDATMINLGASYKF